MVLIKAKAEANNEVNVMVARPLFTREEEVSQRLNLAIDKEWRQWNTLSAESVEIFFSEVTFYEKVAQQRYHFNLCFFFLSFKKLPYFPFRENSFRRRQEIMKKMYRMTGSEIITDHRDQLMKARPETTNLSEESIEDLLVKIN